MCESERFRSGPAGVASRSYWLREDLLLRLYLDVIRVVLGAIALGRYLLRSQSPHEPSAAAPQPKRLCRALSAISYQRSAF